ncbi:ragulator complex protein LAMTOR3-like [Lytechinus pictus]|uniref:ragulator complex protein LAMTOR3-like n=1 Tax=Lytechinus variegatus TaxID=7654 RepID=UPI001BB18ADD|nr:ragulator complex protein LAMTOR3-like [Lytechinus variegatus]XP_054759836.1 ragulator complex protein LAMTOR3-like [Lytechinus pictus]
MVEQLKRYLWSLLQMVEGLEAIVITDRDGVPVIKVKSDTTPEHAMRPAFLATFAMAADQASKLGLSANKSIICTYSSHQVVHFNKQPLFVSLIATRKANTGLLMDLESELEGLLPELKAAIDV